MSGRVLVIKSSITGAKSVSNQLIDELLEKWRGEGILASEITTRDLSEPNALPWLDSKGMAGFSSADASAEAAAVAAASAKLIAEVKGHDVIVIGAPMYNFSIPSQLKNWFDLIIRAQQTFRYGPTGPEGLVLGKKVVVISSYGGVYTPGSAAASSDFVTGYVSLLLKFMGMTDIKYIKAEGVMMSATRDAALAGPRAEIAALPRLVVVGGGGGVA